MRSGGDDFRFRSTDFFGFAFFRDDVERGVHLPVGSLPCLLSENLAQSIGFRNHVDERVDLTHGRVADAPDTLSHYRK